MDRDKMIRKTHVIFIDPKTSKIKHIYPSKSQIFLALFILILIIVISSKVSTDLMIELTQQSQFLKLENEKNALQKQVESMLGKMTLLSSQIAKIKDLDDEIRSTLNIPLIGEDVRQMGIGGSELAHYSAIDVRNLKVQLDITNIQHSLNSLAREVKLEISSFQKLLTTAERKKDSLKFLPVLKPVPNAKPTDGIGNRFHPILCYIKMHNGQDFSAALGTPIIAPADGNVALTGKNNGFGKFVSINHKYGYITNYGHLEKIFVRKGQMVKRGDKIGEVGNTGLSTAPHLHYEVIYKGKHVDPSNYYFDDIDFNNIIDRQQVDNYPIASLKNIFDN